MPFLQDMEEWTSTLSSKDILDGIAQRIMEDPSVVWYYKDLTEAVVRHAHIARYLPDDLVLWLVCNHHSSLPSLLTKEERYRKIKEGEEEFTLVALAAKYNMLSLLEHLAEPTPGFFQEVLQASPLHPTWIPLLQNLLHREPSLMSHVQSLCSHSDGAKKESLEKHMEDLQHALSPGFEPRETSRIIFRLPFTRGG